MTELNSKAVFDALRAQVPGIWNVPGNVVLSNINRTVTVTGESGSGTSAVFRITGIV